MRTKVIYLIVIGVIIMVLGFLVSRNTDIVLAPEIIPTQPTKPVDTPTPINSPVKTEGTAKIGLLGTAKFTNVSVMAVKVLEDSRCPIDVDCVWAGQIKLETEVVGRDAVVHVFTENSTFSFEGYKITLIKVEPNPISTVRIGENDYRFTFRVEKEPKITEAKCYVGGCSGQICSDKPGMASTCIYREVYGCYQGATCERQTDGKCGWTETSELKACIAEKTEPVPQL